MFEPANENEHEYVKQLTDILVSAEGLRKAGNAKLADEHLARLPQWEARGRELYGDRHAGLLRYVHEHADIANAAAIITDAEDYPAPDISKLLPVPEAVAPPAPPVIVPPAPPVPPAVEPAEPEKPKAKPPKPKPKAKAKTEAPAKESTKEPAKAPAKEPAKQPAKEPVRGPGRIVHENFDNRFVVKGKVVGDDKPPEKKVEQKPAPASSKPPEKKGA